MTISLLAEAEAAAHASNAPVEVSFDLTALIMVGLFIILLLVLKPLLFDPMLKLFEERERRIDGAKVEARHMDEASVKALTKYESGMAEARAAANVEREKLRAEGLKAENEILQRVRASAAKTLEDGKNEALAEADRVRTALRAESAQIAKELATRVLGREVSG